mmetsp:Transcript_2063/g.4316  ORF Transcript_2063/g.4316 Transcript_2063/m.4316 type:complete len:319 (-) Transcript_2063:126-1082(-)
MPVASPDSIKPRKQVPKVVLEKGVVDVVVRRCSKAQHVKKRIPGKGVLGMNQRQPVGIKAAKGHVGPHIDVHQISRRIQRYQNHANRVQHASVKGVKEPRIGKSMVGFVRELVKGGRDVVFQQMHDKLDPVLNHQTKEHLWIINPALEMIIRVWHQREHPRPGQVSSQQDKSLGLRQVRGYSFEIFVGTGSLFLNRQRLLSIIRHVSVFEKVKDKQTQELSHGNRQESQTQAQWFWSRILDSVPACREHLAVVPFFIVQYQRNGEHERPHDGTHPRKDGKGGRIVIGGPGFGRLSRIAICFLRFCFCFCFCFVRRQQM